MVLKRQGLAHLTPAWIPNSQFNAIYLEDSFAAELEDQFALQLLDVNWSTGGPEPAAKQIVIPPRARDWYDPEELAALTERKHGRSGVKCTDCGIWRWMPLLPDELPAITAPPDLDGLDIAASPEWFGDGWNSYREVLVRRELAEMLAERSPKDFSIGAAARFR